MRATEVDPACATGERGIRLRLDAHAGPEADVYRAVVFRECATGRLQSDTVPWRQLTPTTLVALGALFGVMFGMLIGRASAPPAYVPDVTDRALPSRIMRTDVIAVPACEDERPGAWTGAL